tara:strand:+ start:1273 stop:1512 length:240 start_codon:yes stop_codon:yes gene_type:complete
MRTSSIHGREGNNYRYLRAVKEAEAIRERKASANIWDDIYKKASDSDEKASDSDQKAFDAYKDINDISSLIHKGSGKKQ